MIQAVINGISMGLLICILVGPVFFALMSIALRYGKRSAVFFSLGILASDMTYALIIYLSVNNIRLSHDVRRWMGVLGGLVFIIMGVILIRKLRTDEHHSAMDIAVEKRPHPLSFSAQGFLTNALNPSVILFRATTVSASIATLPRRSNVLVFIIITLATVFATDMIKITIAEKLKRRLHGKTLRTMNLITGGLLIAIGIIVIVKTLFMHRPMM